MKRRVVVPDTSVIVAAYYDEPQTRHAMVLVDAIERGDLRAFAPHSLICEFLKASAEKRSRRPGSRKVDPQVVDEQVERFFESRSVIYVRESDLQVVAWRLMKSAAVSPPDSWMLACAMMMPDAELWISHEHTDGFVSAARQLHPQVYTLEHDHRLLH